MPRPSLSDDHHHYKNGNGRRHQLPPQTQAFQHTNPQSDSRQSGFSYGSSSASSADPVHHSHSHHSREDSLNRRRRSTSDRRWDEEATEEGDDWKRRSRPKSPQSVLRSPLEMNNISEGGVHTGPKLMKRSHSSYGDRNSNYVMRLGNLETEGGYGGRRESQGQWSHDEIVEKTLSLEKKYVGAVIGKSGRTIGRIKEFADVVAEVKSKESDNPIFTVKGPQRNVYNALDMLRQIISKEQNRIDRGGEEYKLVRPPKTRSLPDESSHYRQSSSSSSFKPLSANDITPRGYRDSDSRPSRKRSASPTTYPSTGSRTRLRHHSHSYSRSHSPSHSPSRSRSRSRSRSPYSARSSSPMLESQSPSLIRGREEKEPQHPTLPPSPLSNGHPDTSGCEGIFTLPEPLPSSSSFRMIPIEKEEGEREPRGDTSESSMGTSGVEEEELDYGEDEIVVPVVASGSSEGKGKGKAFTTKTKLSFRFDKKDLATFFGDDEEGLEAVVVSFEKIRKRRTGTLA